VRRESIGVLAVLVVVVAAAFALRVYGIGWDGGQWIHPDERMILMVVDGRLSLPAKDQIGLLLTPKSPLNPGFHAYGSVPMYTLKAADLLTGEKLSLSQLARSISVLLDCGTVVLAFVLGAALAGSWWGVFAALLVAISPIHIQLAHFYTVDTMLAFWVALGAWMGIRLAATGRRRWAIGLGILAGIAAATKLLGVAILLFAWMGWYLRDRGEALPASPTTSDGVGAKHLEAGICRRAEPFFQMLRPYMRAVRLRAGWWKRILTATLRTLPSFGVALLTFILVDPYALIDGQAFVNEIAGQSLMARGSLSFPYIYQFYETLPYLYPFVQNLTRGWGIGAGLLVWAGLVWGAVRSLRGRGEALACENPGAPDTRRASVAPLLLAWALAFFVVIGGWHTKFPRYLLPIMPLMCALAAGMMADVWRRCRGGAGRWALTALVTLLVAMTSLYAVAVDGVFAREHPWVRVSRWMYENVRPGAKLTTEYWDMALPLPLMVGDERFSRGDYRGTELDLYKFLDTPEKWEKLTETLAGAEYVIVASPRLYGPIGMLPDWYPLASRFYDLLFRERLGFRLVRWEANDARVLGLRLVENPFARAGLPVPADIRRDWEESGALLLPGGDESWTVYDRPLVMIFQNQERLTAAELLKAITPP